MALGQNPKDSRALCGLSGIFFIQGHYEDAKSTAEEAIKAVPNDPDGYASRGEALLKQGRITAALSDLNKAIQLNSKLAKGEPFFYRAQALEKLGKQAQAQKDRDEAARQGFVAEDFSWAINQQPESEKQ